MPFILGIISMLVIRMELSFSMLLWFAISFFLCLIFSYNVFRENFKLRWLAGLCAHLTLFILGACLVSIFDLRNRPPMEEIDGPLFEHLFLCRIEVNPVQKSRSCVGNALLIAEKDSVGNWSPVRRKILVYFKDDSLCKSLVYGDLILISGSLATITGPPNPFMFNFRKYLNNRQIYCQVFLEPGHWKYIGQAASNPVRLWADGCRVRFLEILKKYKIEGQDFALAAALLLGSRDFLDNEVVQEFSHAGAIHVLSVSGLHVGIMYVVADKALFFLKRSRKGRKLHHVLILGCIWAYAFITGLPSSVVRAALMFTLIAAGKMFKRSSESYNILAVAAFLQLWINPYEITEVGFQLSYLAVLGIFAFYKPLNDSINTSNSLLSWVWAILAVSIAAQLATFPLACHYFNMFPVYFLLTNLIVVPLAAVVTYFAVSLLAVGATGLTFEWLGWPLKWSLRFMSGSVEFIQSWPGAVIETIVLTPVQVILIYTAITGLFLFCVPEYRKGAFIFLVSALLFSSSAGIYHYEKLKTTEIIVYQVSGHTAIDFIYQRQAFFICDSLLAADLGKIEFQVKPNRVNLGLRDIQCINQGKLAALSLPGAWINYPFIFFQGKRLMIIDDKWNSSQTKEIMTCDIVIFSGKPRITPDELRKQVDFKQVIIDSSIPYYRAEQLMQACMKESIPCHSVRHSGAFVVKW